jgi:predicted ATPase/signal transduction histidine kinase/tRNA A-37 threonylcarbamoyl transferase component Bud32
MDPSPRYSLRQKIHEGQHSIIFRAINETDRTPVVIKILKGEYPSPRALAHLRREYQILRELDLPGVIRVYGLESYGNGLALVMEDAGGVPLSELLQGQPLDLRRALALSLTLARTLEELHLRSIVHKDIKPHNILVDPSGAAKLIDFGIAMRLVQETPRAASPDTLEGTLTYMSPEQSGRMNRAVDRRTDLYSLGVTMYEMLVGALPFTTTDAIELVHSHIARTPVPPRERDPRVPAPVSDIVMKLLAKAPEDRYQHARALAADLAQCLARLDAGEALGPFELGRHDRPDALRSPQKLYGREREVAALMDAFTRASEGRPELLLVAGGAGVGKSALVHEVHQGIARGGGRFIAGKFDLLQRGVPFSALSRAFGELVRQLLGEPPGALSEWRARLAEALGVNGQLMADLIPELELVIGRQPALPQLRPSESQNRFWLVFQNFVRVFCARSAPLVVFLDDLQWADPASLSLLRLILADPSGGHLLVVGAYRDAEVDAGHPLRAAISALRRDEVRVTELGLGPLEPAGVRALIADSLGRGPDEADADLDPLARLARDKTDGNPFFLTQFLVALQRGGLLRLDPESGAWTWDLAAIAAAPITDNVVDLMSARLRELDPDAQRLLAVAACIGHEFDLGTVARTADRDLGEVAAALWPALHAGLVLPLDADYRLLVAADGRPAADLHADLAVTCRFLHDRVQQAALALVSGEELQAAHLRVGRRLRAMHPGEPTGDALFAVVRHLDAGAAAITAPDERRELARMNLAAGRAAKKATAYAAGAEFLGHGIALLPESAWDDEHELCFALHRERAECEYLAGRFEAATAAFAALLARARTSAAKAELHSLQMLLLATQGRFAEGLAAGRAGLRLFGEDLPDTPDQIMASFGAVQAAIAGNLAYRPIDSLIDAPDLSDPWQLALLRLLHDMYGTAFLVDGRLGGVVILKHVYLSLTQGHSVTSAFGYVCYAYILSGPLGRPIDGERFGRLALQLLERYPSSEVACRVHFMYGFTASTVRPLRETLPHFVHAEQLGLEVGEFMFASQGAVFQPMTQLRLGDDLAAVRAEIDRCAAVMQRTRDALSIAQLQLVRGVVDALQHRTWWGEPLGETGEAEAAWLAGIDAAGLVVVRCLHHICKAIALTLFDEHARAEALVAATLPILPHAVGAPYTVDFPFYAALTLIARAHAEPGARARLLPAIAEQRAALAVWAGHCPENEQHRLHIVDAEVARLAGEDLTAMDHYDRAIEFARRHQFFHHEAIANELCARFHLARGRTQVARVYLGQARYGYERWGAFAKVRDLDARHPYLAAHGEAPMTSLTATRNALITSSLSASGNQGLDLASVIKASQAFSIEIELQPLLEKIIHIMAENAGARRGVLLLAQDGALRAVAESTADRGPQTFPEPLPLSEASLPESLIHFVAHTSDSVILDDAAQVGSFTGDRYVALRRTRSVLCTPLVHQAKLAGVLYLENDLATGAFSEDRLKAIKLIASQAAISIENANLYANMERLVRKRTDELSRVNQSLIASNAELDAFARTVAHDLKNPLGAVAGYSEYLLDNLGELEPGEAEKVLENIRRASHNASSIVDELLLLAGVRKQKVQAVPLDMRAIVRQVQQRMAYMLREYGGELTAPSVWPTALGYAPWIEEAWTNYISNGLKYGGSPPRLSLGAGPEPDGQVRFWVRDHGPGVPVESQGRLFAEFTRLDEVRAEGHGLGLSIVRRIIERLGGRVGVESTPGEGSLFFFTLPTG